MTSSPLSVNQLMRRFLPGVLSLVFVLLAMPAWGGPPPNVVFVLADDLGWMDTGFQGSQFYETPNLDELARHSVRFTDAYAACPVCSPTRASIMTGKYPARINLTDWLPGQLQARPGQKLKGPVIIQHLPDAEITVAEDFRAAGYRTAAIGKWHLGDPGHWPEQFGFDLNFGGSQLGHPNSYFSPYHMTNLPDGPPGEYLTDRLTDEAVKFITASRGRPFFLYLAEYAVHTPLEAKPELLKKFQAKLAALPDTNENQFMLDGQVRTRRLQRVPVYAAMLASLDESVGRVVQTLHALGLATNTIIIFTSDNGGLSTAEGSPTSNWPLRAGKGWVYEGGIREPLLVDVPGLTRPGVCHEPVVSVDYYPTLLALAGLKPARQPLDGIDFSPALRGGRLPPRTFFWHYPHYSPQGGTPAGALRDGDFKLVESFEDDRAELFNLRDDPGEQHDLAGQLPGKVTVLRQELKTWRASVNAQMPVPNPRYHAQTTSASMTTRLLNAPNDLQDD